MKQINVTLDGEVFFRAWTDGQTWNGWECPLFEKDEAFKVKEYINRMAVDGDCLKVGYDSTIDMFLIFDPVENAYDRVPAVDHMGTHLYGIGSHAWIWTSDE